MIALYPVLRRILKHIIVDTNSTSIRNENNSISEYAFNKNVYYKYINNKIILEETMYLLIFYDYIYTYKIQ